jgi:hypothetical protein
MAVSLVTTAAAPSAHRTIVVVGQPSDPRVTQQHALLAQDAAVLRERDVVIQDISRESARRTRHDLRVLSRVAFEVLLVGKDGRVKLRRDAPVAASEIAALIDTMPMRQDEMRRR